MAFVVPDVAGGLPATIVTYSPGCIRPRSSMALSTWRTISSVCSTAGTRKVSTPQVRVSWLRTSATGVNASSGMGDRCSASRRAVVPLWVKATSALAPTVLPTLAAARAMAPLIVQLSFLFAYAVLTEATLSFLGLGAVPPTPTWGNIMAEGRQYMREAPWIITIPGLALAVTVMGLNLLGDGLRDVLDPRLRLQP